VIEFVSDLRVVELAAAFAVAFAHPVPDSRYSDDNSSLYEILFQANKK
jgi:hypothetical protein